MTGMAASAGGIDSPIVVKNAILHLGESLRVLQTIESASVDALIADPPYSSGGFTRSDRTGDPSKKYVNTGTEIIRGSFSGDNRDGRSWCYWMALWLSEAARIIRPRSVFFKKT